jgi:hypothetical protein
MKVLFFSMNAPGTLAYAVPMLRSLGSIADVTVVDYWSLDLFPLDAIRDLKFPYLHADRMRDPGVLSRFRHCAAGKRARFEADLREESETRNTAAALGVELFPGPVFD